MTMPQDAPPARRSYLRTTLAATGAGLLRAFNTNKTSWVGLGLFAFVCALAILAPVIAPHDPLDQNVFNRPGLGRLIVGALNQRDYTMLQGMMVIYTLIVVLVNLLTDLTYGLIDPRIKYK